MALNCIFPLRKDRKHTPWRASETEGDSPLGAFCSWSRPHTNGLAGDAEGVLPCAPAWGNPYTVRKQCLPNRPFSTTTARETKNFFKPNKQQENHFIYNSRATNITSIPCERLHSGCHPYNHYREHLQLHEELPRGLCIARMWPPGFCIARMWHM